MTLPGRSGVDVLTEIRRGMPVSRLMLSMHDDEHLAVRRHRAEPTDTFQG